MPLSTIAKAALCVCPPALMAGTVATVPAARKAVHQLTSPRAAPKAAPRNTVAAARPAAATQREVECDPGVPAPIAPLVTYAAPIPQEPGGTPIAPLSSIGGTPVSSVGAAPPIGAVGVIGGNVTPPVTPPGATPIVPPVAPPVVPPVTDVPSPGPVPEPSTWLMLIAGVGTLGAMLRRRRRAPAGDGSRAMRRGLARKAAFGSILWPGGVAVEAGDMAATVAVKSAVASAATKAMLCVCPVAVVAGGVMAVPPLRQAVHASTMAPELPAQAVPLNTVTREPCPEPMSVPVATAPLSGFPATVATVPAAEAATAPAPAAAIAAAGPPAAPGS